MLRRWALCLDSCLLSDFFGYYRCTTATMQLHSLQNYRHTPTHKNNTFVESDSPSTVRPSSLPWLYTGTPLTWQRQSCQSWWCHRLDPPIPSCIVFHFACSVDHKHHPAHMVLVFPLDWCLWERGINLLPFVNKLGCSETIFPIYTSRSQNNNVQYVDRGWRLQ